MFLKFYFRRQRQRMCRSERRSVAGPGRDRGVYRGGVGVRSGGARVAVAVGWVVDVVHI